MLRHRSQRKPRCSGDRDLDVAHRLQPPPSLPTPQPELPSQNRPFTHVWLAPGWFGTASRQHPWAITSASSSPRAIAPTRGGRQLGPPRQHWSCWGNASLLGQPNGGHSIAALHSGRRPLCRAQNGVKPDETKNPFTNDNNHRFNKYLCENGCQGCFRPPSPPSQSRLEVTKK